MNHKNSKYPACYYCTTCPVNIISFILLSNILTLQKVRSLLYSMSIRKYRVQYKLDSLETRSTPLFSNVKAFLLNDNSKRLISEGTAIKDKRTVFEATIEQQARSFTYNNQEGTFESSPVTILLEFGAENRFIKMGETHVDLAKLLNSNKNGETIAYKLEKCYDRNARLHLAVTFWDMTKSNQSLQRVIEVSHSRSQSILPYPRIRTRTQHDRNKVPTTEYSQLTDRQDKEQELSVISDKFIPTIPKNLNKTDLFRKNPIKTQQSQQIVDLKTQNRIYQHQIAQFQLQYRDIQDQADTLKEMIKKYRYENEQLNNYVDELKRESAEKEQSKEAMREQLNTEIARLLKLYQESEHQRNKLLIQRQQEMTQEQERFKESEKKVTEEKNKVKVLERNQQGFRRKIEEYMSQIVHYEKTIKTDQRTKLKLSETVQSERKEKEKLKAEIQAMKSQKTKLKTNNDQLQSQLQISRFSLQQLEREVSQLRRVNKEQLQKISRYEEQIKQTNEAFMSQRSKFTRKIQEIDHKKELQQQAMEAYMEELQIKSINQHTKNGQINMLKREMARLKNELSAEHDKAEQMENENKKLKNVNSQLDQSIEEYQAKIMELSKTNAFLENQVSSMQSYQQFKEESYDEGQLITQQEKEELIAACYEERDEIWKKELQKIENDTRTLMDKTKREKEEQVQKIKKLNEEIASYEEDLKKEKAKVKESNQAEERLRKANKEIESKCIRLERSKSQLETENAKHLSQIKQLSSKEEIIQELQESISQLEKKMASMKNHSQSLKADLQKQQAKHKKLRTQMKEFVNTATSYLGKSQKHRIFYDQFRSDHIDAQLLMIFNSAAKLFCDKHNRLRIKLQQLEEMKGKLESKEKQCEKMNKSIRQERRGSCDSNSSIIKSQSQSTTRIINAINGPNRSITQKEEFQLRHLKKELEQLRTKMKKEGNRYSELERDFDKIKQNYEQSCEEIRRCKEEADMKDDLLNEIKEKIRMKEKQLEMAREETSDLNSQVNQLKNQLEEVNKAYKQEKNQNMKKSTGFNKSLTSTRSQRQETSLRTQELQKKVKSYQEEIERLKREKQERRGDNLQNRQVKNLENRIKEKQEVIAGLRDALEEEREKTEQLKELQSLKVRKLKEQFEEQIETKTRVEKELNQALIQSQEKLRQLQKKIKMLQDNVKSANNQLTAFSQREQKNKRLLINQWQLKLKTLQGQHEAQLNSLTRKIDQTKLQERSTRQLEKRKDRQLSQLRLDLERSERTVVELTEKLDLYGIRLKNMQEQQSNYKEVIGVLENKMKAESSQERKQDRECQKDTFDNHSNFSLKTFTFR